MFELNTIIKKGKYEYKSIIEYLLQIIQHKREKGERRGKKKSCSFSFEQYFEVLTENVETKRDTQSIEHIE